MTDTVTAKLAEWEADMDRRVPAADLEDRNIARALLGFVREVREGHTESEWRCANPRHTNPEVGCPECYTACDTCDHTWPCPTEQAALRWIGGEGR